jgi:hypothetical protein
MWADRRFGPAHGFISGWYYWTGNLFYFPMQLVYLAGVLAYAAQGPANALVDDKLFVAAVAIGWLALVTALNVVGLGVGKWLPNIGAVCTAFTAALGIYLAVTWSLQQLLPPGDIGVYEMKLLAGSLLPLAVGLGFFARARRRARLAGSVGPER